MINSTRLPKRPCIWFLILFSAKDIIIRHLQKDVHTAVRCIFTRKIKPQLLNLHLIENIIKILSGPQFAKYHNDFENFAQIPLNHQKFPKVPEMGPIFAINSMKSDVEHCRKFSTPQNCSLICALVV